MEDLGQDLQLQATLLQLIEARDARSTPSPLVERIYDRRAPRS
jgi:hypothetical protein